jgi:hypothetical protein
VYVHVFTCLISLCERVSGLRERPSEREKPLQLDIMKSLAVVCGLDGMQAMNVSFVNRSRAQRVFFVVACVWLIKESLVFLFHSRPVWAV